jgi:hypothetical protein
MTEFIRLVVFKVAGKSQLVLLLLCRVQRTLEAGPQLPQEMRHCGCKLSHDQIFDDSASEDRGKQRDDVHTSQERYEDERV